jgi:mRNA interferase RelE/StbE
MGGQSAWSVEFFDDAFRQLDRLDAQISRRITAKLAWVRDHADEVDHLPLQGQLAGLFKLRVGDWRVIYEIDAERALLIVHAVKHRREAYQE